MSRGPEYADQLTSAERRTLDTLVAEVGRRQQARRSWRAPLGAGLTALVILLTVASINHLGRGAGPDSAVLAEPAASAAGVAAGQLAELAEAAAGVAVEPADDVSTWYQHRLDLVVSKVDDGAACRLLEVEIFTEVDTGVPVGQPATGQLVVEAVSWRGTTDRAEYCTKDYRERRYEVFRREGVVLAEAWEELAAGLGGPVPRFTDPRVLPWIGPGNDLSPEEVGEQLGTDAGGWWVGFVRLLASPQPGPELRAAALRAAAARAEAVAVPEVVADHTGRPGITVRVPYSVDGVEVAAELTFDRATGAIRQSLVHTDAGVEITVYLAAVPPSVDR